MWASYLVVVGSRHRQHVSGEHRPERQDRGALRHLRGSGMGKTNEHLAPSCRGAKLLNGKVFKRGVSKEELAAWAESL